ncbi:predicted protein [Plenodomus lingam JN3]|uniref:Predicted protein n=1 Tax=Leptosphaeria maculans (strain JN3 / isolate v23.1.3 / race Av1-4-5-6-7-8) TaxID=985895 RepID=E4ZR24_LEPMJ|nr:predicted protein [Plenodomus lingam JN3]CBX93689.1 predicted protein [Plenodomus lingam JN3]
MHTQGLTVFEMVAGCYFPYPIDDAIADAQTIRSAATKGNGAPWVSQHLSASQPASQPDRQTDSHFAVARVPTTYLTDNPVNILRCCMYVGTGRQRILPRGEYRHLFMYPSSHHIRYPAKRSIQSRW